MPSPKKSRIHRRILLPGMRLHDETSSRRHKPPEKSENMHNMRTHNLKSRKKWRYDLLIPIFRESGLENIEHFKRIIKDLEKALRLDLD